MTPNNKKYLIVGGVAGGATAAARIRRLTENAEIILFEKGAYISYANCGLPYYINGRYVLPMGRSIAKPTTNCCFLPVHHPSCLLYPVSKARVSSHSEMWTIQTASKPI